MTAALTAGYLSVCDRMSLPQLLHSTLDEYLVCFQISAIVITAAMCNLAFGGDMHSLVFGTHPGSQGSLTSIENHVLSHTHTHTPSHITKGNI